MSKESNDYNIPLSKIGILKGGNGFPIQYQGDNSGIFPFYKVSDMNNPGNERYMLQSNNYVSTELINKLSLNIVNKNSVIFAKVGAAIMLERKRLLSCDSIIDNNMMAFTIFPEYDSDYIYYSLLNTKLSALSNTGALPSINSKSLYTLSIFVPPLPEQKKIAEILSTWDEAIEFNEKLLDTEKQQKSVYVSNIYTKRHVTNIENVKKFEKLSKHLVEKTERNRDELTNDVLSVSNTRGFVLQSTQFEREIASRDKNNYKVVRKGQFAYNPSRVNVGSIDQLSERDSGIISPMYVVFECKDSINGRYLYHFLKSDYFLRLIPRFTQGSVRDSLSFDGLCKMKIHIPTIDKQIRYSSLLDTIDKKIDLLERNIVCLKTQKQGLMQRLLTGKVRVKLD